LITARFKSRIEETSFETCAMVDDDVLEIVLEIAD
jgi:hypothetical protein